MFIKKITNRKAGNTYLTYRLVKSKRIDGIPIHVSVLELGSLSDIPVEKHKELADRIEQFINGDVLLFDHTDDLIEESAYGFYKLLVKREIEKSDSEIDLSGYTSVDLDSFEAVESKEIGGEWLCKQAIEQLGLPEFLSTNLGWNNNQVQTAMLALLGRLLHPSSELRTAKWLNENSAAMELYCPDSKSVDRNRLQQAAVMLYKEREKIERHLSQKTTDIYNISSKYVLYDLTNTHFEGKAVDYSKAKYGRNKQKRNDCPQVTLALLTDENGFCKSSKYYDGNVGEPTTFVNVVIDAKRDNTVTRPVIIMDAGIASDENLQYCLSQDCDYICVSRSSHQEIRDKLDKSELESFQNKAGDQVRTKLFDSEITYEKENKKVTIPEKVLYVETDAKKGKEQGMFEQKRIRFEKGLEEIKASLLKPRANKKLDKIHERIGGLKQKYAGIGAAYDIKVSEIDGNVSDISYVYDPNNAKLSKSGSYFIRTSLLADKEELLWKLYRTIGEIESTFRILKSDLNMRPIHHSKDENIEAHLNLAVLAYFIVSFIRYKLKKSALKYCWDEIVRIMNTQKCNWNTIIDKNKKKIILKICTRPTLKTAEIYKAMGYKSTPFYRIKKYLDS